MLILFILLLTIRIANSTNDPELHKTVPELIQFYNYPVERHNVTTKDGYILELHRIPYGRDVRPAPYVKGDTRPVIVCVHGLFSDSSNFVLNPPPSSPGYIFADSGFDVWLINCRGTAPSRRHVSLSPHDKAFWNFTFLTYAERDLPDSLDYILSVTGQKSVYYVGHSQGTAVAFAAPAEDKNASLAKKIRQVHAMGPAGGFKHIHPVLRLFGDTRLYHLADLVLDTLDGLPIDIPQFLQSAISETCRVPFIGALGCQLFGSVLGDQSQINASRYDVYIDHFPTTTSMLNLLHWAQVIHFHGLRKLDLGPKRNKEHYGQAEAPILELSYITTETYIYFSEGDHVTSARDVRDFILSQYGPGLKEYYDYHHFSHIDFAIGLRAPEEVFRPIVRTIYKDLELRAETNSDRFF